VPLPAGAVLLHEFFDLQWREWRDRIAVDIPPGRDRPDRVRATYGEIAALSQATTSRLDGVIKGEAVAAVLLPRTSAVAFAAPLGILRAGAAYTSLDPAFPDERIEEILADSAAVTVVTDTAGASRLSRLGMHRDAIIIADDLPSASGVDAPHPGWLSPSSLAYMIYTSGTTGRPKGVMTEHRAIANLVRSDRDEFGLSGSDRVGQSSSHAYDSSIEEIWLAFAAGATLVVLDDDVARAGPDLVPWLEHERITVLCPPPTLLRATGRRDATGLLPALRLVYVGGEALTDDVVSVWAPGRRLVNGYGPTECAVTSVRTDSERGTPVTIGTPIPHVAAHIVDERLQDVPDGTTGELCLSGAGLARGYRNDPALTAAKFPSHPVHGRMYRTGDLARRDADGTITCLGRLDSQVKIRGYRVELGEIDARIAACPGVRAAASTLQAQGQRQTLVAFIVPVSPDSPPDIGEIRSRLTDTLPVYMVPAHFVIVPSLPTTVGGKIDRNALPVATIETGAETTTLPRTELEHRIEQALRRITDRSAPISTDANFFHDIGGDSLLAAELITALRADPATSALTVRDAYEAPTIAQLAAVAARSTSVPASTAPERERPKTAGRPVLATIAQVSWLALELVLVSAVGYSAMAIGWPSLVDHLSPAFLAFVVPIAGIVGVLAYLPVSVAFAVLVKRAVVGTYVTGRSPVWGFFYVRHWVVCQTLRIVPWRYLEGTVFHVVALRALGARIGRRVHIHRGADLMQGGWDLLEIGDDVTIGQEAVIRLVDLDDEQVVVDPVVLGNGATIETRASIAGGATIGAGGLLTALSSLNPGQHIPAGERWDGVPASAAGRSPDAPPVDAGGPVLSPLAHGVVMLGSRVVSNVLMPTAAALLFLWIGHWRGFEASDVSAWLRAPGWHAEMWLVAVVASAIAVPLAVTAQAIAIRLLGRLRPGVISRWSVDYLRVWAKTDLLRRAGDWLAGTLMWPIWLRVAGMRIGRDCEMSTIIDVVPELVSIGAGTFFADGVYLGGPRVHRGTVTLAETTFGTNVFLGNHVVVPAGSRIADGVLIGVSTVARDDAMPANTSWFGHPPFALARPPRQYVDPQLTHHPSLVRYVNRWLWEIARFLIPVVPMLTVLGLTHVFLEAQPSRDPVWLAFLIVPAFAAAAALTLAIVVLALKWILLGRVRPGQHALWSCWCSRWDFHYVVWDKLAGAFLARFEGTLLLAWYLRAIGMRIGRRVVLGPGFAQVVDPDMIRIDDDATVHALFQAHTFEDRMLKIDRVRVRQRATVGCGSVLFYGVDVGEDATVAAQSVIMKQERLAPRQRYEGCPSTARPYETVK
jgi:non-ribosomal peptide synthetase-like protein